jgi:P-type Ca2+ transporter type 2C
VIEPKPLSQAQADQRLMIDGPNVIKTQRKRSLIERNLAMGREPMFLLLVLAAGIYLVLGDLSEGLVLGTFVVAIWCLTLYQEGMADASIAALRELSQHHAQVIRSGAICKITSDRIVVGDWVQVSEGDRIPADGLLVQCDNLEVDESLLTGESLAVRKEMDNCAPEDSRQVFSGTFVVRGQGLFIVKATGAHTEIGKIGSALDEIAAEPTPLQRQTEQLVKTLSWMGLMLCSAMVIALGVRTGDWLGAFLSGIALGMAMLPEEYPVVLTIFPALGAHRLAKQGVLTRHINAIETLGATTVLCTDKTGTLTQNRMQVQALAVQQVDQPMPTAWLAGKDVGHDFIPKEFEALIAHAVWASAAQPFDPMEEALHLFGQQHVPRMAHCQDDWFLVKSYPLGSQIKAMTQVWRQSPNGFVVAGKGAPEAVMNLCHLSAQEIAAWQPILHAMSSQGLRVLAVAQGHAVQGEWPDSCLGLEYTLLGLIGLSDPIRDEVPQAMNDCLQAGIRVVMITGDYPTTACSIAVQVGMPKAEVISGDEVDRLTDSALQERMKLVNVCARINPHQKLRIVQAFMRQGEIVTMTGDGVNDAPALRAAHVGVAMGARGTDVARSAADLVLVDDHFASIVGGIRTGRRIFANLKQSMSYIFAIHIPIAGLALFPMWFDQPALFLPLHIALIEMIIDPACSLAFENEPESGDCMSSPPRDTRLPLFDAETLWRATAQGILVLMSTLASYAASVCSGLTHGSADEMRSMVMVTFVVANGVLIFASKSRQSRPWPSWFQGRTKSIVHSSGLHSCTLLKPRNVSATVIALGTVALVLLTMYWPWAGKYLRFEPLSASALGLAFACGCLGWVVNAVMKR